MEKQVVVLLALLALIPFAPLRAAEPPVAPTPAQDVAIPAPEGAQCLVTPSEEQTELPTDLAPDPLFTSCTDNSECPAGELCCNLCGAQPFSGANCLFCVQPVRKRCPLVV